MFGFKLHTESIIDLAKTQFELTKQTAREIINLTREVSPAVGVALNTQRINYGYPEDKRSELSKLEIKKMREQNLKEIQRTKSLAEVIELNLKKATR